MSKSPAFQFYPADWLSSPKIQLMNAEQEGGYIRLLCYCWSDKDCSLPDDDVVLSKLSRLNEGWFNGGSTMVRECFILHPTKIGFLTNERLLKEREKQKLWKEKSIEGGKNSGESRRINKLKKHKNKSKGGSQMVEPPPRRVVEPNANSMSLSLSLIKNIKTKKEKNKQKRKKQKEVIEIPAWLDETDWNNFVQHRKEIKKPMSDLSKKKTILRLEKFLKEGQNVSDVINNSIANGWTGLFKISEEKIYGTRKKSASEIVSEYTRQMHEKGKLD